MDDIMILQHGNSRKFISTEFDGDMM